jgi:hypothetical protein
MRIEKRSMGWIQKPSAYQYQQNLNAKRKAVAKSYMNQTSLLATTIFTAKDNASHDMVALILKATINRVTSDAAKRLESALPEDLAAKIKGKIDKTA